MRVLAVVIVITGCAGSEMPAGDDAAAPDLRASVDAVSAPDLVPVADLVPPPDLVPPLDLMPYVCNDMNLWNSGPRGGCFGRYDSDGGLTWGETCVLTNPDHPMFPQEITCKPCGLPGLPCCPYPRTPLDAPLGQTWCCKAGNGLCEVQWCDLIAGRRVCR